MRRQFLTLILWTILAACRSAAAVPTLQTPTAQPTTPATETAVAASPTTVAPTNTTVPSPTEPAPFAGWPTPIAPLDPFDKTAVSPAEQQTFDQLSQSQPPERNDISLAAAYWGADSSVPTPAPVDGPLPIGSRQSFNIGNLEDNTVSQIEAALTAVGDHAYFWFDTDSAKPDPAALAASAAAFDAIYETNIANFGAENSPGIDGDRRIYIVHAAPAVICGQANCGIAGYFSAENILPQTANPNSNEHEMFIMNADLFGSSFYLNVLGHEFRHMIEDNHDRGDADWVAEGSATLAEDLLGYPQTGQQRGNMFLQNPDQQLNSWTEGNTLPYYGQGYLLNRTIYDRLGADLYRQFATSPAYGLQAVDAVAAANGLDLTGERLWLDWLVMLALHNDPNAPELYRFGGPPLDTVTMTAVNTPTQIETTVAQYAADYYELPAGSTTIHFQGQTRVPLLPTAPVSGAMMWIAQRANYGNPRLTRIVDLRDAATATLEYAVYADIEQGYDFGYVSVSVDDGRTWQPLIAENMQGLAPEDDPSDSAYADRFYTGRSQTWVEEQVDLSQFAGQLIQLRFEYVTDLILTYGGLALDNIAIPEIGFYDDGETAVAGWQAEGFIRATATVPQPWHLQLITNEHGAPAIEKIALADDQTFTITVNADQKAILIIAAAAPFTLEPAQYKLNFSAK